MYEYRVVDVIKVIDGDTIDAEITLGFSINAKFRFRLAGIDTPEMRGEEREQGLLAQEFVTNWIQDRSDKPGQLCVQTFKSSDATVGIGDGSFGRWLGSFFFQHDDGRVDDLNLDIIQYGFQQEWW